MKVSLTFLGTGGFFTETHGHSNMVLQAGSERLLIDAGPNIGASLKSQGLRHTDIDSVYISHMHGDHAGGLEWLALARHFDHDDTHCQAPKLGLFAHESTIPQVWQMLQPSLGYLYTEVSKPKVMGISDYFICQPLLQFFEWWGIGFELIPSNHIVTSYGLCITIPGKKRGTTVYISSDCVIPERAIKNMKNPGAAFTPFLGPHGLADWIFHDCETHQPPSGVHAHFEDLCLLPPEIKSRMWLYHYSDGELPDAKSEGFAGFVSKGETFDFTV